MNLKTNYALRNLLIAVFLGGVAIMLLTSYLQGQKKSLQRGQENVTVLVAKADIPAGTTAKQLLGGSFLEEKQVLRRDAAVGAISDLSKIKDLSVATDVYSGQQLTTRAFEKQSGLKLADGLKGNERAMMLPVGVWQGMGNYVKTGDRVDIFASGTSKVNGEDTPITWVVARDVEILKTPNDMLPEGTAPSTDAIKVAGDPQAFMFKVTDKVAEDLIWAQAHSDDSKLIMVIRPSNNSLDSKLSQPLATHPAIN